MEELISTDSIQNLEQGFSSFELFLRADWVVQSVMVVLVICSIWSWAIIAEKKFLFSSVRKKSIKFKRLLDSLHSINEVEQNIQKQHDSPLSRIFIAAVNAYAQQSEQNNEQEAIYILEREVANEIAALNDRISILATVASAAPFIGLFGTVWGIMNSFSAIAVSQQTNLAVVAPGIAEALFATALGLVAAIPASIGYNSLTNNLQKIIQDIEDFESYIVRFFFTK